MSKCLVATVEAIELVEGFELELLLSGELKAVAPAGRYNPGDWFVHIPNGAVLPAWLRSRVLEEGASFAQHLPCFSEGFLGVVDVPEPLGNGLAYTVFKAASEFGKMFDDQTDHYHYIAVDKVAVGVAGFVVYLHDDVAPLLQIQPTPDL